MADVAGYNQTVTIDDSNGTSRAITAHVTSSDLGFILENDDTTNFGDVSRSRIFTMQDRTFSIEGNYDTTASTGSDTVLGPHAVDTSPVTSVSISYSPDGGTTTYSGEAVMTSYNITGAVDSKVAFSAEFVGTGNWART